MKDTLRTPFGARLMPTLAACLRRVPWVDALHVNATFLRLVIGEGEQLRERPTMQLTLVVHVLVGFAASHDRGPHGYWSGSQR